MKKLLWILLLLPIPLVVCTQHSQRLTGPKAKNTTVAKRNQSKGVVLNYRRINKMQRMMKTKHTIRRRRTTTSSLVAPTTRIINARYWKGKGPRAKNQRPERPKVIVQRRNSYSAKSGNK